MKTYYSDDTKAIKAMDSRKLDLFVNWMSDLEEIMDDWESRYGWRPYPKPLAKSTGLECWKIGFDDGLSANEAFNEDRDCWDY